MISYIIRLVISLLYPNNIKKNNCKTINYANRGMKLEALIDEANLFYQESDVAIIYKKPTPVAIGKVDYVNQNKVLTKGYFKCKSTLDYVGIYKGRYIDFDAKSTTNKTSLPLSNIHNHQLDHINNIIRHGGITFILIEINHLFYILKGEDLIEFIKNNERKSIPYSYITSRCHQIKIKYNPVLDYIKVIEKIY